MMISIKFLVRQRRDVKFKSEIFRELFWNCFPRICDRKRTNNAFKSFEYKMDFQKGRTCFASIPHFDFIRNIPLDYMHPVCLDVVGKMIHFWLSRPLENNIRLPASDANRISEELPHLCKWMPCDFIRKPPALTYLKLWKPTELSTFLLYLGSVVLCNILNESLYNHFLGFHVALTILTSPTLPSTNRNLSYASELLNHFVSEVKSL